MKINKIIFILLCCLFCVVPVNAAIGTLEPGKFTVECIYEDGLSIEAYYENGVYGLNYTTVKLSNKIKTHYESSMKYFYKEQEIAKSILDNATCESGLLFTVLKQYNDQTSVHVPLYALVKHRTRLHGGDDSDDAFKLSEIVAGFKPNHADLIWAHKDSYPQLFARRELGATVDGELQGTFIAKFSLVTERVKLKEQIDTDTRWSFESRGEQAASKRMYVDVYKYKNKNGQVVLLAKKGKTMTRVSDNYLEQSGSQQESSKKAVCFQEATRSIDTNSTDSAYVYSRIQHGLSYKDSMPEDTYKDPESKETWLSETTCPEGVLYVEVAWRGSNPVDPEEPTSICDVLPSTVNVLGTVIAILQILVPVLLIGLTAFDIGKIVVSGNLDEELPKKRKDIIIRMIVAIFFFFLPVIIQLITAGVTKYDFGDVGCLFEIAKTR